MSDNVITLPSASDKPEASQNHVPDYGDIAALSEVFLARNKHKKTQYYIELAFFLLGILICIGIDASFFSKVIAHNFSDGSEEGTITFFVVILSLIPVLALFTVSFLWKSGYKWGAFFSYITILVILTVLSNDEWATEIRTLLQSNESAGNGLTSLSNDSWKPPFGVTQVIDFIISFGLSLVGLLASFLKAKAEDTWIVIDLLKANTSHSERNVNARQEEENRFHLIEKNKVLKEYLESQAQDIAKEAVKRFRAGYIKTIAKLLQEAESPNSRMGREMQGRSGKRVGKLKALLEQAENIYEEKTK